MTLPKSIWTCRVLGIYYTLQYGRDMLLEGQVLLGHDFEYDDEICGDHWVMICTRCGFEAHTEEGPAYAKKLDEDAQKLDIRK